MGTVLLVMCPAACSGPDLIEPAAEPVHRQASTPHESDDGDSETADSSITDSSQESRPRVDATVDSAVDHSAHDSAQKADSDGDDKLDVIVDKGAEVDPCVSDTISVPTCGPVINEIQVSGPCGASDEFVEVFNPCEWDLVLAGVNLVYRSKSGTKNIVIEDLSNLTLSSRQYLLLAGKGYCGEGQISGQFGGKTGMLSGSAGAVGLAYCGLIIDSVGYGEGVSQDLVEGMPSPTPPSGSSLARRPDGHDTNDNSQDFAIGSPTPGRENGEPGQ